MDVDRPNLAASGVLTDVRQSLYQLAELQYGRLQYSPELHEAQLAQGIQDQLVKQMAAIAPKDLLGKRTRDLLNIAQDRCLVTPEALAEFKRQRIIGGAHPDPTTVSPASASQNPFGGSYGAAAAAPAYGVTEAATTGGQGPAGGGSAMDLGPPPTGVSDGTKYIPLDGVLRGVNIQQYWQAGMPQRPSGPTNGRNGRPDAGRTSAMTPPNDRVPQYLPKLHVKIRVDLQGNCQLRLAGHWR